MIDRHLLSIRRYPEHPLVCRHEKPPDLVLFLYNFQQFIDFLCHCLMNYSLPQVFDGGARTSSDIGGQTGSRDFIVSSLYSGFRIEAFNVEILLDQ